MGTIRVRVSDHAELAAVPLLLPDDVSLGSLLLQVAEALGKDPAQDFSRAGLKRDITAQSLDLERTLRELQVEAGDLLVWTWGERRGADDDWLSFDAAEPPATNAPPTSAPAVPAAPAAPMVDEAGGGPADGGLTLAPAPLPPPAPPPPAAPVERQRGKGSAAANDKKPPGKSSAGGKRPGDESKRPFPPFMQRKPSAKPRFVDWIWNGAAWQILPGRWSPLGLRRIGRAGGLAGVLLFFVLLVGGRGSSSFLVLWSLILWTLGEGLAAILEAVESQTAGQEQNASQRQAPDDASDGGGNPDKPARDQRPGNERRLKIAADE